eukprot:446651_1
MPMMMNMSHNTTMDMHMGHDMGTTSTTMDHMGHNMGHDMDDCPMRMYFHWSMDDCVLFYSWRASNAWQYALTCVVLVLMCLVREFALYVAKWYEFKSIYPDVFAEVGKFWITASDVRRLHAKLKGSDGQPFTNKPSNGNSRSKLNTGQIWYNDGFPMHLRVVDGVAFAISLLFGYWTMLVVMTYNGGYFIVICMGFIVARIIFYGQSKNLAQCLTIQVEDDSNPTETCH